MVDLVVRIIDEMETFAEDAKKNLDKGNKAAGTRARNTSLQIEKLLKEYRKISIQADKL